MNIQVITKGMPDTTLFERCCVTKSSDQVVSTKTWTNISFNEEEYDVGDMHDNVTNNSRITIKKAGDYRINYHIKTEAMDKASYESRVRKNGSIIIDGTCDIAVGSKDSSNMTLKNTTYDITFVANDYIELQFYHDKDVDQDIRSSNTFFELYRVR